MTANTLPWYVARAGGLVAYVLLTVTVLWGTAVAARAFRKRPGLPWINAMHEWLGVLTAAFIGVHLLGLATDSYIGFGVQDLLVPFASSYRPGAVAWGVVSLYLSAVTWASATFRQRLPKRMRPLWKRAHLAAYPLFAFTTVHLITAGTDSSVLPVALGVAVAVAAVIGAGGYVRTARHTRLTGNSQGTPRDPSPWGPKVSA
jgi:hypothetical protein